jgi:hypothetical protein
MLPASTIRMIDRQIQSELRNLNSIFCNTQADKMAAIERINALQSMLNPSPTADEIADALAAALSADVTPKPEPVVTNVDLGPLLQIIVQRLKKH